VPSPEPILAQLRPAERILLELCKSADPDLGPMASADPEVLREFMDLSAQHAVQGLVFLNLRRLLPEGPLWHEIGGEIQQSLSLLKRRAAFWDLEQDRVLTGLGRAGFQPLVLKGGALRRWVFESPLQRVLGDLDILVQEGEVEGALEALRSLGYKSTYSEAAREGFREHLYHDRVTHANGFEVEVHWGLSRPGSLTPLDPDLFQQRARILRPEGSVEFRVPSPEDMVLHTVSQSEQDDFRNLRRLVDLDRLLVSQELDWAYVCAEADRSGLSTHLAVALRLANLLLGSPVPHRFLQGKDIPFVTRRAIALMRPVRRFLRKPKRARVPDSCLFGFWCLRGLAARGKWIMTVASGLVDPLTWVWEETEESESIEKSWIKGAELLLKLIVLQSAILGMALGSALRQGGRRELRFWKVPASIPPPESQ